MIRAATNRIPAMCVDAVDLGRTPLICVDSPDLVHLNLGERYLTPEGRDVIPQALAEWMSESTASGRWNRNTADTWHMIGGLWRR